MCQQGKLTVISKLGLAINCTQSKAYVFKHFVESYLFNSKDDETFFGVTDTVFSSSRHKVKEALHIK